ncbi:hypothetical protein DUNSADRAFT_7506 [Dunaliella salina]|uniref:BRO1 domain-containing protein n=1 Tax=Dunaliella salina TaxID=3046 RepID=A0ABQ7GL87_DUNSA|nr:hypothetical protein DUNSADRAFT_7506 [Dunaliella salina]|eukprot:KAF5835379.1 hypothetical protein DUNSADRAFT_7506 [Dunaliella salina]
MESFKDKVDRSWGDGLGRFADGRLRMLMQVSGGSQKRPGKDSLSHEELRKCACQPWLNQELTDDVLDGFFEESAEFCTQALLDPRITLACGKSDDNLVASIRKTFIALWRCKRSLGMDWQSCILGRLLGALQELAESLIKAARERGIGATEGGSVLQNGANCGTGTGARLDLSSSAAGAGAESARAAGAEADGAAGAEAAGAAEGIRPVASGTSQPYQPEQPTPTESDPSPSRPSDFTASSSSADPANALLKSKDGQARQFAILHRAARTYMDFARKIYDTSKSDGCKTCSNQGVNVICSFRALVYACKLLADMASSPQPVHSNESNATQEVFEEETLCMSVSTGIANVAALSLATDYPTLASIPHSVINGYKNVLGLSLATGFSLSQKMERKYDLLFVELTQSAFNQEQEELRIERAREASSFFRDVKVEWTNAKGDDPVTLCNR